MDGLFLLLFLASIIALVVGLIKPSIFSRLLKGQATRKGAITIFGIAAIAFFILFGVTSDSSSPSQTANIAQSTNTTAVTKQADQQPTNSADTNQSPTTTETEQEPAQTTTPVPTQVEQKDAQDAPPVSPVSKETVSQKNAVAKAKSYLSTSAFSHDGLVAQLEYEQFSHADAVYGADNSGADWNVQAVKKAKSYLENSAFSHDGLVDQLVYEKFTQAQAVHGADNSGADWNEQAAKKAKSYMENSAFSRSGLIEQLKYEKFTQAQAEYGADSVGL